MLVRPRRADDLDQCVALLRAVHLSSGYPVHWPQQPKCWLTVGDSCAAWVAEQDGVIVGHVALQLLVAEDAAPGWLAATGLDAAGLGELSRFFVGPEARNQGVGSALLRCVSERADARHLQLVLEVVESDRVAIAMYERRGWRKVAATRMREAGGPRVWQFVGPARTAS